jgi:hypothetical protein
MPADGELLVELVAFAAVVLSADVLSAAAFLADVTFVAAVLRFLAAAERAGSCPEASCT